VLNAAGCEQVLLPCADPMGEQYLRSQAAYANGGTSPHISPCDSAYDRDKDSLLKNDSHAPSGLERASSAHDEVLTICNGSVI